MYVAVTHVEIIVTVIDPGLCGLQLIGITHGAMREGREASGRLGRGGSWQAMEENDGWIGQSNGAGCIGWWVVDGRVDGWIVDVKLKS